MSPSTIQPRAWEGICALAVWVLLTIATLLMSWPGWAFLLFPIPSLLIGLDALGPRPLFVRWQVGLGAIGVRRLSAVLVAAALAVGWLTLTAPAPRSDQPPILTCAARDLLRGMDPYQTYEPQCLALLHINRAGVTPLEEGPFRNDTSYPRRAQLAAVLRRDQRDGGHAGFPAFGYPPDAALLVLPVAWAGWLGISLWVAAMSALLLLAIWGWRFDRVAPLLAWQLLGLALLWYLYRWNPEEISYLLLALAFARIDRVRVSALALAGAVCSNPLAWPAALIYGAVLARDRRRRARLFWVVGAILVGTLPWLLFDHRLLGELWTFVTLPEFPLGGSLGVLAPLPSHSHLVFELGLLLGVGLAAAVAVRWPAWRWAMAVLVYGAFLLSWRGLLIYYTPVFWLSPAVVVGACRLTEKARSASAPLAAVSG
ncbi:MAG TPA: hypothetical protein VI138_06860 [Candidatus Dormibacteraeota bacterium]